MTASQEPSSPSQMLSLEEAASELRISIDSLLDLCVTGKLICFRVGYDGEVLRVIRRDLENCRRIVALPQEPHHV